MSENYSKLMTMKEARSFLPVSNTTIRRWVDEGKLPAYKTEGGHRKFFKEDLLRCVGARGYRITKKLTIGYCRVSSAGQKDDLIRQEQVVTNYCEQNGYKFKIIKDIGSGINYSKKGLQELIRLICNGDIERIVISYKDRLVIFGYKLIEIEIINSTTEESNETEMVKDVLSIITVFSSKLYGKRSHKNKNIVEANKRLFYIEKKEEEVTDSNI